MVCYTFTMKVEINSEYLKDVLEHRRITRTVKALVALIKHSQVQFSTIVFRGMSGALIAPIIAYKMHKQIAVARKTGDGNHSSLALEGHSNFKHYIIIDDFIATGNTINTILNIVKKYNPHALECQAIFCYRAYGSLNDDWKHDNLVPLYSLILNSDNNPKFFGHNMSDETAKSLAAKFLPKPTIQSV